MLGKDHISCPGCYKRYMDKDMRCDVCGSEEDYMSDGYYKCSQCEESKDTITCSCGTQIRVSARHFSF
jgi:hypothetical protein